MNARLLIVDDERDIREMLSRHFRLLGYNVDLAENGKAALDCLNKKKYQVVISDLVMPKMSGVELLREIRENYPMTHSIMITGYITMDNALACMRYRADTLVFKPLLDLTQLNEAVERAITDLDRWQTILRTLRGMKDSQVTQ